MYIQLLALVCVSILVASAEYYELENASIYFEEFIIKFEKKYANEHEKAYRFEIFKINLDYINRMNEESDHAVFGITLFTDLNDEEFTSSYTGLRQGDDYEHCTMLTDEDIPDVGAPESFDWRELNVVTRVKNQLDCGSCWAFSAIGHLEGQQAIKHKELLELSEQQLVDCDFKSNGCCGGLPSKAFEAASKMRGIMLEKDYPYENKKSACRTDERKTVVKVTDCFTYNLTSQEKVKQLLYKVGPLSIAIKSTALKHQEVGIISDKSCNVQKVDHAVLLVGYGTVVDPRWFQHEWAGSTGVVLPLTEYRREVTVPILLRFVSKMIDLTGFSRILGVPIMEKMDTTACNVAKIKRELVE